MTFISAKQISFFVMMSYRILKTSLGPEISIIPFSGLGPQNGKVKLILPQILNLIYHGLRDFVVSFFILHVHKVINQCLFFIFVFIFFKGRQLVASHGHSSFLEVEKTHRGIYNHQIEPS